MSQTNRSRDPFATLDATFVPAARRVARIILRALDYLPPGEASFIDYGRAFVLAARTTYKRPQKEIRWLKEEFVRRGIVESGDELETEEGVRRCKITKPRLARIVADDKAAMEFVEQHRSQLQVSDTAAIQPLRRVVARKSVGPRKQNELLIKLCWQETEQHNIASGFGDRWAVCKGATMIVDLDEKMVSMLQTVSRTGLTEQRGAMLKKLYRSKRLSVVDRDLDVSCEKDTLAVKRIGGIMHLQGAMRLLHIVGE